MLSQLRCHSFRNLADIDWRPGAGCHLILGPNGAGKSSLLEAVYLLATTRSFRTSRLADCVRAGEPSFDIHGEVDVDGRISLHVGWSAQGPSRSVNGNSTSLAQHLGVLPLVAWSAADGDLLTGTPGVRRRFLDRGIVGLRPGALETLSRYRRALDHKRRLLESEGEGLVSWNRVLAAAASELMLLRRDFTRRVAVALERLIAKRNLPLPEVEMRYRPSIADADGWESVFAALEALAARERRQGRPLAGPHRDELEFRFAGRRIRGMASGGERKALGLALAAAREAVLREAGRPPVLLLDDADAELDAARLEQIWPAFADCRQMLVSSSRPEVWSFLGEATRWPLSRGRPGPPEGLPIDS